MTRFARSVYRVVFVAVVALCGGCADPPSPAPTSAPPTVADTSTPPTQVLSDADRAMLNRDLVAAAWANDVPRAAALIDAGADVNFEDDTQQSAILIAASEGYHDLLELTLERGADPEARDAAGRTPLLLAVTNDHVPAARVLIALGADPDALDDRHDTPWLVTGVTGSVAMADVLLPAHPDLTIVNRFGGTSIIPASERGHVEYVRRVAGTGIDLNHVNYPGWTALLEAVVYGDGSARYQEVVAALLAAGADPAIPDAAGITAYEHAVGRGQTEIAALLASG